MTVAIPVIGRRIVGQQWSQRQAVPWELVCLPRVGGAAGPSTRSASLDERAGIALAAVAWVDLLRRGGVRIAPPVEAPERDRGPRRRETAVRAADPRPARGDSTLLRRGSRTPRDQILPTYVSSWGFEPVLTPTYPDPP